MKQGGQRSWIREMYTDILPLFYTTKFHMLASIRRWYKPMVRVAFFKKLQIPMAMIKGIEMEELP